MDEFKCEVLSKTGNWQNSAPLVIKIPVCLKACQDKFFEWYKTIQKNRKVEWQLGIGSCQIKPTFTSKSMTIVCNFTQACIIDAYNLQDSYTFGELKLYLGINMEGSKSFTEGLMQLCNPKN